MSLFPRFALVALAAAVVLPAHAQFAKPEDAVDYRQSAFTIMGNHMGRIWGQLKSGKPDVAAIQKSAAVIEVVSKLPYEAFGPGTDLAKRTDAKPEVWTQRARFDAAADKMQGEVVKLNAVAKTGDVKAIQAQFSAVNNACKACHDDFKTK